MTWRPPQPCRRAPAVREPCSSQSSRYASTSRYLQAGDAAVPRREALRVLRCDAGGCAVGATKDDGHVRLAARHVVRLGGRVNDLNRRFQRNFARNDCVGPAAIRSSNRWKRSQTWSMACMEKLKVMNSQMGLRPAIAAPTAMPAKPWPRGNAHNSRPPLGIDLCLHAAWLL